MASVANAAVGRAAIIVTMSQRPVAESSTPMQSPAFAAVLIVLKRESDGWHVLFIRRSTRENDRHSGQVAFPGGRVESSDRDMSDTALREAEEEIGLPRSQVQIIAQLAANDTSTGFVVTPVVAILDGEFEPVLRKAEVARLFSIPLDWLKRADNRESRLWGKRSVVYFSDFDGERLWGATARMTLALIDALESGDLTLPA